MKQPSYLLGVDLGTGGCKCTLVDAEGRIRGRSVREYPTSSPAPGWAEQDPQDWTDACSQAIGEVLRSTSTDPGHIQAVAFDAATHTCVLLDEGGRPLRPAILWTDRRARVEAAELKDAAGDRIAALSLHRPDPMWTLPQLVWIKRNDAHSWRSTRRILFAKDYVRYYFTGAGPTDRIDACGSMLWDVEKREWSRELCELAGLDPSLLPPAVEPTEVVGAITAEASLGTGLKAGTPVVAGTSDTAAEVYGAGAVRPGQCTIKLATAGRICVVSDGPRADPLLVTYPHVVKGLWYPGTGTKSCASSYRWLRDRFFADEVHVARRLGLSSWDLVDLVADRIRPGSDGLLYHPYLLGELSPYFNPLLRGSFVGLTMSHHRGHLARAVLEGTAMSLRDSRSVLDRLGLEVRDAILIGGGARSRVWSRILADVMGLPLRVSAATDASFGSALLAGVGSGVFGSLEEGARKASRQTHIVEPEAASTGLYDRLFPIYKSVAGELGRVGPALAEFEAGAKG